LCCPTASNKSFMQQYVIYQQPHEFTLYGYWKSLFAN
jgi:hypothetical protein